MKSYMFNSERLWVCRIFSVDCKPDGAFREWTEPDLDCLDRWVHSRNAAARFGSRCGLLFLYMALLYTNSAADIQPSTGAIQ